MSIHYISHGLYETGGYLHETALCEALGGATEIRFRRNFKGIFGWLLLFCKAFFVNPAPVSVTVARLAWPVYLRNAFNGSKIILVLHNLDKNDGKPKLYFILLSAFIKLAKRRNKKIKIVVVSQFMRDKLEDEYGLKRKGISNAVCVFPNVFDTIKYDFYKDISQKNTQLIHLGQYSEKIDKKAYHNLNFSLKNAGYVCYFSSPIEINISDFPITYFNTHEAYLKQMARSAYTVIVNSVEEGWNRVAHESLLVGTPILACAKGGVNEIIQTFGGGIQFENADLIADFILGRAEANSTKSNSIRVDGIENNVGDLRINREKLNGFDMSKVGQLIYPIKEWLLQQ